MNIELLPSGSYRVRKQINGRRISLVFDKKPSNSEILRALSEQSEMIPVKDSFEDCANSYIASKNNVISPSTVKGYGSVLKAIPRDFKRLELAKITQADIQKVINEYSADHQPKTVRNLHGFISAVLRQFRPNMVISTTLPQKVVNERYIPSEDDIKRILVACKDHPFYHIPFQLGVMGLRRSEICALELSDISGNTLSITKALVTDKNNNWVIKPTKTAAGTRQIYIPDKLVKEIQENGCIYNGYPNTLLLGLNMYQDKLGIPRFRFHDLRHFFASYAHQNGMSDADIMASGGWKSDFVMKGIYRHEMNAKNEQKRIFKGILE